jgi:hypothetical protein
MGFKTFLESRSSLLIDYMINGYIPVSPKFFDDIKTSKIQYCFIAIRPTRIDSLLKRQGKKNQMSTFTKWTETDIFWGPTGDDWVGADFTVVGVLKGTAAFEANKDIWTLFDVAGRRWINADQNMFAEPDPLNNVFIDISGELKDYLYYNYKDLESGDDFRGLDSSEKRKLIAGYFDTAYRELKKNTKRIQKALEYDGYTYDYNEVLCHSYKIQEILIIPKNNQVLGNTAELEKLTQKADKAGIKYTITDTQGTEKILKKYQKKNKGL